MRKLLAGTATAIVSTAALAATSQAASGGATGDTCVANGTGSAYTLTINLTSGAPQQDGFAVGVKGGTVTRLTIGGVPGKASTSGLPAGTDRAWLYGSPQGVAGGSVELAVRTSSPAKSFTVVPYDQEHQQWFDAVTCPVSALAPTTTSGFTVGNRFAYHASAGAWTFSVTLPGPGTLDVSQSGGAKLLIAQHRTTVSRAGTMRVSLGATAAGRAVLARNGRLTVRLSIEFSPKSGIKPTTKTMTVTLAR